MDIISWVYRNCRFAAAQATFDDRELQQIIEESLGRLRNYYATQDRLRQTPLDFNAFVTGMRQRYTILLPQIQAQFEDLFNRLNANASNYQMAENIARAIFAILRKQKEPKHAPYAKFDYEQMQRDRAVERNYMDNIIAMRRLCLDLTEHIGAVATQADPVEQKVEEYRNELMVEYNKSMAQVEEVKGRLIAFAQAMKTDCSFDITPNIGEDSLTKEKHLYPISFHVEIHFPNRPEGFDYGPSFSMFDKATEDGQPILDKTGKMQYDVDDVIDWGDTDFFTNNNESQFYFQLIDYIRSGTLPAEKPISFLKLYRGMSPEEFVKWEQGEVIPKGKFFTSVATSQFAQDVSGQFPELFSFRVRSDALAETSPQTFQLMRDCKMETGKKIVPIALD